MTSRRAGARGVAGSGEALVDGTAGEAGLRAGVSARRGAAGRGALDGIDVSSSGGAGAGAGVTSGAGAGATSACGA